VMGTLHVQSNANMHAARSENCWHHELFMCLCASLTALQQLSTVGLVLLDFAGSNSRSPGHANLTPALVIGLTSAHVDACGSGGSNKSDEALRNAVCWSQGCRSVLDMLMWSVALLLLRAAARLVA
jgi:hypothetical protein